MFINLFIFTLSLFLVVKSAMLATRYASNIAKSFHISRYVVGFFIVAIISILPEAIISINAALAGIPSFGLGLLFGSNVADLSLVFALVVLFSGRTIKIESKILKTSGAYLLLLLLPILLGFDGYYSRLDGVLLMSVGLFFFYLIFKNDRHQNHADVKISGEERYINTVFLLLSVGALLMASQFTVHYATVLAGEFNLDPILIGMLVVGLGTTMPELFFSLNSVKKHFDALAVGDILGTVLADATIVVGILAFISPFYFPQTIIYLTGLFMIIAYVILYYFMRSERELSEREGFLLLLFYIAFVIVEFMVSRAQP